MEIPDPHHLRTNQNPWPAQEIRIKPRKGEPIRTQHLNLHQKVTNQTRRPVFQIFHVRIPYISNVTQSSGLLPIAAASVSVGAPARAWCKNSLAFASDIGSLVVIGRFRDLGITFGSSSGISHRLHGKTDPESHLQPVSFFLSFFSLLVGPGI